MIAEIIVCSAPFVILVGLIIRDPAGHVAAERRKRGLE